MEPISTASRDAIIRAAEAITASQRAGGTLFIAGNGGSLADALHIAGELTKDFERPRPLPGPLRARLVQEAGGAELATGLQQGMRAIVLGINPVLATAIDNDFALRHLGLAQELCALGRPGDVLLAISTSGRSPNLLNVARTARALDLHVVSLTGPSDSPLGELAEVTIRAAGSSVAEIQTSHVAHYHELCRLVEEALFPT